MGKAVTRLIVFIFLTVSLTACANKIGVRKDFKRANFEIGKTTKKEVIDYLGLPQKIMKYADGREHYFYPGAARLTGLCIGCGDVSGRVGVISSAVSQAAVEDGAEYIFTSNGVLVAKYE